jgi:hypothetical protein
MRDVTEAREGSLGFLDQIFFYELVVSRGMDASEFEQLTNIVNKVGAIVNSRHSGREAEILKHLVYCFLELSFINPISESAAKESSCDVTQVQSNDPTTSSISTDQELLEQKMKALILMIKIGEGFDASFALDVFKTLKHDFIDYSQLVKCNLAHLCFAHEFLHYSLETYCWLSELTLIKTKYDIGRFFEKGIFEDDYATRLIMLCNFVQFRNSAAHGFDQNLNALTERLNDCLHLEIEKRAQLFTLKQSLERNKYIHENHLKTIQCLYISDFTEPERLKEFFIEFNRFNSKPRFLPVSPARLPGMLAAGFCFSRIRFNLFDIPNNKIVVDNDFSTRPKNGLALFSDDEKKSVTAMASKALTAEMKLTISARTICNSYTQLECEQLNYISKYCDLVRKKGEITTADSAYIDVFL